MSEFWPFNLDLSDTLSPLTILTLAQKEWAETSGGVLGLVIQKSESTKGHLMLIVHAKHIASNRTATLFTVVHRLETPYPARIQPRDDELPDMLKKSYYQPSFGDIAGITTMGAAAGLMSSKGRMVTNEGVCNTPSEFRAELKNVFNSGTVKSEIISLIAGSEEPVSDSVPPALRNNPES